MPRLSRSLKIILFIYLFSCIRRRKVIDTIGKRTDTDRSATCYFVLVFHSNYSAISCRFWDKGRYLQKKKFHPMYLTSRWGVPIVTALGLLKLEWCPYQMVKKAWRYVHSFRQYRHWTDGQTDGQTDGTGKQYPADPLCGCAINS